MSNLFSIDDRVLGITARFDNHSQGPVAMVVYNLLVVGHSQNKLALPFTGQSSVPRRVSNISDFRNLCFNSRALLLHVWDGNGLDCPK